jgi:hypothetical protein
MSLDGLHVFSRGFDDVKQWDALSGTVGARGWAAGPIGCGYRYLTMCRCCPAKTLSQLVQSGEVAAEAFQRHLAKTFVNQLRYAVRARFVSPTVKQHVAFRETVRACRTVALALQLARARGGDASVCASVCVQHLCATWLVVPQPGPGHANTVLAVAVSPDGRFVYSGSDDKAVNQWDTSTGMVRALPLR